MNVRILICVVIYNQIITECNSYKTLLNNQPDVIVIDNSNYEISDNQNITKLKGWKYVKCPNNPGLGVAYNIAAKFAKDSNYNWLLLSDQDTSFEKDIINDYKYLCNCIDGVYLFCPRVIVPNKGLLSPVKLNFFFPKISQTIISGNTILEPSKYAIINSGMLINIDAFFKVGGYNENVFLDFSDFQFIEKFCQYFDKVYVSNSICYQEFSNEIIDSNTKLKRFRLFCKSLKQFKCRNRTYKYLIHLAVLRRTISLCIEYREISPIKIFIKEYIL